MRGMLFLIMCVPASFAIGCQNKDMNRGAESAATVRPAEVVEPIAVGAGDSAPPREHPPHSTEATTLYGPPLGRPCRVQLRRDTMGVAAPAAIGVLGETLPGKAVQLTGTIDRLTPEWLVLRAEGRNYWIPREMVLLIEFVDDRDGDAPPQR